MGKPARTTPHFELFRRIVRRVGVPERNAEDLAQEALLRGWEARERIEPSGDPAPYSVTIARNLARKHLRDASRRGEVLTPFDEHDFRGDYPNPEAVLRSQQREALTRYLIDQVDPKYRDLLVQHELEEKPLAEIAAELGLKLDTVKTQHRRAREHLDEAKRRWMAQQRRAPSSRRLRLRRAQPAWRRGPGRQRSTPVRPCPCPRTPRPPSGSRTRLLRSPRPRPWCSAPQPRAGIHRPQ